MLVNFVVMSRDDFLDIEPWKSAEVIAVRSYDILIFSLLTNLPF